MEPGELKRALRPARFLPYRAAVLVDRFPIPCCSIGLRGQSGSPRLSVLQIASEVLLEPAQGLHVEAGLFGL
jgi:hypothetical protein